MVASTDSTEFHLGASAPTLLVIVGSTRPGRVGRSVADWIAAAASEHGAFDVEVADLAEIALPLLDEPEHPASGRYLHQHTKAWSATVSRAAAFVMVLPEYNHGYCAGIKNAIDYLHREWHDKPVGLVSYGGVAAGTRAVQALKPVLMAVKAVPVLEAVAIPFVGQAVDGDGSFRSTDHAQTAAKAMLDELARKDAALRPLRTVGVHA